jgi:hypothetical protein
MTTTELSERTTPLVGSREQNYQYLKLKNFNIRVLLTH